MARLLLAFEFLLVFGGGPLVVLACKQRLVFVLLLWLGALIAWRATRGEMGSRIGPEAFRREVPAVVLRFVVVAALLVGATLLFLPDLFLSFPRDRPWLWLAVMLGYPALSVWPQEMIYRRFVLVRYRPLFGSGAGFIAASAIAFGYAHLIFLNPVAVTLSAVGGGLFAANFARHRSLALVWMEHALYGCLIFTIGFGRFFVTGMAWHP